MPHATPNEPQKVGIELSYFSRMGQNAAHPPPYIHRFPTVPELTFMSNPYQATAPGPVPAGMVPPDLASKANNLQIMGILSIVFGFCCGCVGLILSIIVLVQAGGVTAALQQYGSPPELMSKVSTGKLCAIIGLVVFAISTILSLVVYVIQIGMAVQHAG
jgi:hypothetical protein